MNVFEYKKRYDPELGRYVKKNIYTDEIIEGQIGEGLTDFFKSNFKKAAKWGLRKVGRKASEKVSKKAGDKINQLLSNNEAPFQSFQPSQDFQERQTPMSQEEINERINRLMSGGKLRKIKYF